MSPDLEYTVLPVRRRIIKVTITNTQSTATANPHVQEIRISHTLLASLLGAYIDVYSVAPRVMFLDPQMGAQAPSWYEWYDGTYHHWFVKTGQIGASSTYTLYMIVSLADWLVDGKNAGISAMWEQQYVDGQYGALDNGKNVFLLYDNFAGTSLSSIWNTFGGGTISVNNGLTITVPSGSSRTGIFASVPSVPSTGVIGRQLAMALSLGSSGGNDLELMFGNGASTSGLGSFNGYSYSIFGWGNTQDALLKWSAGSSTALTTVSDAGQLKQLFYRYFMWYYTTSSYLYGYESLTGKSLSASDTTYTLSAISQIVLDVEVPSSGTSSYLTYSLYYFDAPPNGVMPSVQFSPLD